MQVAAEAEGALGQLVGLVKQVTAGRLGGVLAVAAVKAARTLVAARPRLLGRLASSLLNLAAEHAAGERMHHKPINALHIVCKCAAKAWSTQRSTHPCSSCSSWTQTPT